MQNVKAKERGRKRLNEEIVDEDPYTQTAKTKVFKKFTLTIRDFMMHHKTNIAKYDSVLEQCYKRYNERQYHIYSRKLLIF